MKKLSVFYLSFMMSAFLVLQAGCGEDNENNQNPDVTASTDTISGVLKYRTTEGTVITLADWPFGPGMLRVVIGGENVASTALQSDGNFTVILPGTVKGSNFTNLSDFTITYGGTVKATPETAMYVGTTQFIVDYTENSIAKNMTISEVVLNHNNTIYRNYYHYFYDGDGSLSGTGTAGNTFNWVFSKGWGTVESYMSTTTPPYVISSKSVAAAPTNAVWIN